ncbi:hypothetical protein CALCODRAFT_483853 [Calocera cornea HHB12733]|uniref:DUF6818 domain-containing protein n=1 Tax=Calocera cornea HHB12733 TaxID=1353952 RepID=A0A165FE13_9BASI|nr:hypothetical protein CALCODRAFT_483853 [Calocera cornea HHB12733]
MSSASFHASSPTPTPSYIPSTFPQPSPTYVQPSAPFPTLPYVSHWGTTGSSYSGSPRGMPHSPQFDTDGLPRTLEDAVQWVEGTDPLPTPLPPKQAAQPGSGKNKRKAPATRTEDAPDTKKRPSGKGRSAGARNFADEEVRELIELIEEYRPIGSSSWDKVMLGMQTFWASEGMEVRTAESLKRKFSQMCRMPKPTGDGEMPELIGRAKDINVAIQNDVEMGNLQDEDEDEPNDADEEEIPWPPTDQEDAPTRAQAAHPNRASHTPSTSTTDERLLVKQRRHVTAAPQTTGRQSKTSVLLANVSRAFDPEAQAERMQQRDTVRAERSLFQSEISSLQAQLRDKQAELVAVSLEKDKLIESLRTQALQDARALLVVQGELDVAKAKLEMQERMRTMMMGMGDMGKLIARSMSLAPGGDAQP